MSRSYFWVGVSLVALGALAFSANPSWARGGGGGGGRGGAGGFSGGGFSGGGHSFGGNAGPAHIGGPSISSSTRGLSPNFSSGNFNTGNHSFNSSVHNFSLSHQQFGSPSFQHGGQNFNHNFTSFQNAQNWSHNSNWNHGNWGWNYWHNHGGVFFYVGGPFWWPAWWGGGYPYGYDYGYDDSYPYQVAYADVPQTAAPTVADETPPATDENASESDAGAEFFAQSVAAFNDGKYKDALRLANHAAVEAPQNPKAHELMSLSLFALGEWRPAAMEGHAALALGPPADWNELYSYYGDENKYTSQLRELEKYSKDNPNSAEAHFLRGYQYLMMGHTDAFKEQMQQVTKLAPKDKLATELLSKYGGGAATNPPLPPPPTAPGTSTSTTPGASNVSLGGVDS